jgi:type I restriction enzyme S subunit
VISNWKFVALGDLCDVIGGGTPAKDCAEFYRGDIPWATVRDMRSDAITNTEFKITPLAVKHSSTNVVPKGNVVIATRVGLGKVGVLQQDTAINQDLRAIVPRDAKRLLPGFLFWWFKSVARLIVAEGAGATVQGVKLPFIKSLPVPLLSPLEQRHVVSVLDEAFAGLETATANAEKNLKNARELFESQSSRVFGMIAQRHGSRRLAEIVTRLTNGYVGPTRNIYLKSGIPYLLARHVRGNQLEFDGKTFVSSDFNEKNKKSKLRSGDVLLVQSGHIGHSAVVGSDHEGHNCHAMIVITPVLNELSGDFLSLYFGSAGMQRKFEEIRSGSTVPHLTCGLVRELMIPLPKMDEQQQIVAVLKEMEQNTARLASLASEKILRLAQLKQAILKKAFSGELTSPPSQVIKEAAE